MLDYKHDPPVFTEIYYNIICMRDGSISRLLNDLMVYSKLALATRSDMSQSHAFSGHSATPTLLTWKDNNYHTLSPAYLEAMNTASKSQCE